MCVKFAKHLIKGGTFGKPQRQRKSAKTKAKSENKNQLIIYVQTTKNKANTPANVHPPVVVVVVVVVVFRFVLCRFLSSGHATYSRSPSFVSLLLMLHHKHTKLGVFLLSLSLPCVRSLVAWRPVSLSAMLLVLTFTKQQAK